ncbi:hypothetical protein [Calothrix sp. UHCC 0171]|uniref:hypothetical protein n=1 Tax=Calothrix sp. UHCC 0171 TaxID=3110245 RepID=UPI002B2058EA|nr:hypothetical protein [Calothrix sp. UHCC 0171]MEA5571209.1 hypothetical protein [Calothrix sp. UHCC 0171]
MRQLLGGESTRQCRRDNPVGQSCSPLLLRNAFRRVGFPSAGILEEYLEGFRLVVACGLARVVATLKAEGI